MNNKKETLKISLIAIFLGILLGVVILLVSGKNPFLLFNSFLRGIIGVDLIKGNGVNLRYFGEFIVTSMPIVLTGLSVGFAYRTGLFNIGAEGQLMVGAMTSIVVCDSCAYASWYSCYCLCSFRYSCRGIVGFYSWIL